MSSTSIFNRKNGTYLYKLLFKSLRKILIFPHSLAVTPHPPPQLLPPLLTEHIPNIRNSHCFCEHRRLANIESSYLTLVIVGFGTFTLILYRISIISRSLRSAIHIFFWGRIAWGRCRW